MQRRTFLHAAGTAALASVTGCATLQNADSPSQSPRGVWRQNTGTAGNTSMAPTVSANTDAWTADLPGEYPTPPVVAAGVVVVGTAQGTVVAFDLETGHERWRRQTAGVQGAPAQEGDWVLVPADDGRLHRFSIPDGSTAPPLRLGSSLLGSVSTLDGRAFVLARPGTLVAVDVDEWRVAWSESIATRAVGKPAVTHEQVVTAGARLNGTGTVTARNADSGAVRWTVSATNPFAQTPVATMDAVGVTGAHDNRLASGTDRDDTTPAGVFWFDADGSFSSAEPVNAPVWPQCTVRFLVGPPARTTVSGCNALVTYAGDGLPWTEQLPQGIVTRPLVTPEGVLVGDAHGSFWLVRESGRTRRFDVDGIPSTPAILDQGLVVPVGNRLVARI